uniref:Ternary complex factor MIP1 leucine-zipper domain-containing protein n=1 Tax=Salix viminalis TaxID=40686 RepID=A0A6N2MXX2_SALVM
MNTSARSRLQSMKAPMKLEKEKAEMQGGKPNVAKNRRISSRERKIALQQDVDNLKKQLRHEESIHRALEEGFQQTAGSSPSPSSISPSCDTGACCRSGCFGRGGGSA